MAKDGIRCPRCNCGESRVRTTKTEALKWMGKVIASTRRRRICMRCHHEWRTDEICSDQLSQADQSSTDSENQL